MIHKIVNSTSLVFLLFLLSFCHPHEEIKIAEERTVFSSIDKFTIEDTSKSVSKSFELDLNKDSYTDYIFSYAINYHHGEFYCPFYMYVEALGGNEILVTDPSTEDVQALALERNELFSGRWATSYATLVNPPYTSLWESKGIRYMGFRLKKDNKYYVGWIKMEIGKKGSQIIFYEYAYRLDNANQMKAGQR